MSAPRITDEAVRIAWVAFSASMGKNHGVDQHVRAALEAAMPHLAPRLDREALTDLLRYCRSEADSSENVDGERSAYDDTATKLGVILAAPQPVVDREALAKLAAEWRQSADEDERYLNSKVHASEVHDVMASIRINREHADAVLALLDGGAK